tara:strand:- start:517 stop:777 length:261 start_codon:yes stop_codon:yes gene_type:complete
MCWGRKPPHKQEENMGPIIRINTTYLVEVTENDIKHIDKFGLDEFILGDMRNKRKLVVSGKSSLRKSSEAVWKTEEKKQEQEYIDG